jgi:hypothetical protein
MLYLPASNQEIEIRPAIALARLVSHGVLSSSAGRLAAIQPRNCDRAVGDSFNTSGALFI